MYYETLKETLELTLFACERLSRFMTGPGFDAGPTASGIGGRSRTWSDLRASFVRGNVSNY
jgi:hypothetical protein